MYEVAPGWYDVEHLERQLILDITVQLFISPGSTLVDMSSVEREFGGNEQEFLDTLAKLIDKEHVEVIDDNRISLRGEYQRIFEKHTGRRGQ